MSTYLFDYKTDLDIEDISPDTVAYYTNDFADEYLIAQGSNGKVYKAKFSSEWVVARQYPPHEKHVVTEIMMCKLLKHKHIISDLKTATPEFLINPYQCNESLDKHLSDPTLSWMKRLKICVGVAQALSYMHSGLENEYMVIHGNIKSSKILLDEKWEPKLRSYGNRVKKRSPCFPINYKGTLEYLDPAYESTESLTPKSDVFSFGVVLFEVLFGRKASIPIPVDEDNWTNFAQFARFCYQQKRLDATIHPDLRQQMSVESLHIFSETAFYCLEEQRSQRPDMDLVVKRLELALEHQKKHLATHLEPTAVAVEDEVSKHLKGKSLDYLKIQLSEIKAATNNFSEKCRIGYGGFGEVYKANLNHFDGRSLLTVDGKIEGELPKKHSTVAIKRLFNRGDGQEKQGFIAEIDLLSSCKHENVVSLLGFCYENHEMILIYEYASNGSLEDYLGDIKNMKNFNWAQRIQICLDIANGLKYLHTSTDGKKSIIHRDMKSANILLDNKWRAKIADFGLSVLHQTNQQGGTFIASQIAGTKGYLDPEYQVAGKLKTEIDVYSFGVILFELVCGKLTYDQSFNQKGLASIAREYFKAGTLKELVDPRINEMNENIFKLNGALNQDSLGVFSDIAYQCLSETQSKRPTMDVVIEELQKALILQKNNKDDLNISLDKIKLATKNFSDDKCIAEGKHWKQYEGQISHANAYECTTIIAKRWDSKSPKRNHQYLGELKALLEYKHNNIIGLVGYCNEMNEKIIVYQHASNGKVLSKHLDDTSLTWLKRLKISIDIASGLSFLHKGDAYKEVVLHKNIKSSSIVLDGDCKAKISNLELSKCTWGIDGTEDINMDEDEDDSLGYIDPDLTQMTLGFELDYDDMFSLGVVLMEILCGRLAPPNDLGPSARWHYKREGNLNELVFEGIKDQIHPESLSTYSRVAYQCLRQRGRTHASSVVTRLKKALELQEDYDIWEPKLPRDYVEICQMSRTPKMHTKSKRTVYRKLTKGILLQQDKKLFTLGSNGERTEMVSATEFSYKNRGAHKWRSIPESRFQKVAKMLVISNLNIKIKLRTQLLSLGIKYGAYLVFKFRDPRKFLSKSIYVNLTYKIGSKTFHSYFAQRRENNWMMIELHQFLNQKKVTKFEVLIESFSKCYCGNGSIYIEGIEFRVIDDFTHQETEEIEEDEEVEEDENGEDEDDKDDDTDEDEDTDDIDSDDDTDSDEEDEDEEDECEEVEEDKEDEEVEEDKENEEVDEDQEDEKVEEVEEVEELEEDNENKEDQVEEVDEVQNLDHEAQLLPTISNKMLKISENAGFDEKLLQNDQENDKRHFMLAAKEILYNYPNVKVFHLNSTTDSRYQEAIELQPQQVFRVNCKIGSQMLSSDKEYMCYLVFKLSEKCHGLHCPVKVRDLLHRKNKEPEILYFRSPNPWNLHDINRVPEQRNDGWLEVKVWKFNSSRDLKDDCIHVNLKLISYEGTMSGLILSGLEFRLA